MIWGTYAAVGAAATTVLERSVAVLEQASANGVDVADLLGRATARKRTADDYIAAFRRWSGPSDGLAGVQLEPFQILASEVRTYSTCDHGWHLDTLEGLVKTDPGLIRGTRSLRLDLAHPTSLEVGTQWWLDLSASGGEDMVVKPFGNLVRGSKGAVQPGRKVRGREVPADHLRAGLHRPRSVSEVAK